MRPHKYFSLSKNKEGKNFKFIQLLMSYIFHFLIFFTDDNQDGCEKYLFFLIVLKKKLNNESFAVFEAPLSIYLSIYLSVYEF